MLLFTAYIQLDLLLEKSFYMKRPFGLLQFAYFMTVPKFAQIIFHHDGTSKESCHEPEQCYF